MSSLRKGLQPPQSATLIRQIVMQKIRTHYENLQVAENASNEVIRGAYKYLAQKWHPDKHQGDRVKAEGIMKILNKAYEVLSDPELRKDHDQWLALQRNKMSQGQNEQTHRGAENRRSKNAHQDAEARRQDEARQDAINENLRRDAEKAAKKGTKPPLALVVIGIVIGVLWIAAVNEPDKAVAPKSSNSAAVVKQKPSPLVGVYEPSPLVGVYENTSKPKTVVKSKPVRNLSDPMNDKYWTIATNGYAVIESSKYNNALLMILCEKGSILIANRIEFDEAKAMGWSDAVPIGLSVDGSTTYERSWRSHGGWGTGSKFVSDSSTKLMNYELDRLKSGNTLRLIESNGEVQTYPLSRSRAAIEAVQRNCR